MSEVCVFVECDDFLNFIDPNQDNQHTQVITDDDTSKRRKRTKVLNKCGYGCKKSSFKKVTIETCTGSISCCTNCEMNFTMGNRFIGCVVCHKNILCTCEKAKFISLTCRTYCCACYKVTNQLILAVEYALIRAPPSTEISVQYLARESDLNTPCAKLYHCHHCKQAFMIENNTDDFYFHMQQWFCKGSKCQVVCAKYFRHIPKIDLNA